MGRWVYLLASLLVSGVAWAQPELSVDLHSHLFMSDGLSWMFHGDFDEPLHATSWKDKFSSQANPASLDQSNIGILVVALYAHPATSWDLRDSIRHQIQHAKNFVRKHPNWIIARSPQEARQALSENKRVLVLSLEGASGIIDNEKDIEEFVDRDGIRIVTLLHLIDDRNGGVAFMGGIKDLATPLALLQQAFKATRDRNGVRINHRGLSAAGEKLTHELIAHKVWIDLSHASDRAQEKLIPILRQAHQPLLYTHTALRRFRKAERGISDDQLEKVRETHGIVGIAPSEEALAGTPDDPAYSCKGSIAQFATVYKEMAKIIGADSVMLGSDFNGATDHLSPSCGTHTSLDKTGFWNTGQTAELWKAVRLSKAPVPSSLGANIERFLEDWEEVQR